MGRVGMVLDLVAEFVMGRVCQGPSLSWAEFVMGRDVPESIIPWAPGLSEMLTGLYLCLCLLLLSVIVKKLIH